MQSSFSACYCKYCPIFAHILHSILMWRVHHIDRLSAGILLIILQCPSFTLLLLLLPTDMLHPSSSSNRYAVKHLLILHSVLLFTVVVACTMSILTCIVLSCNALHCLVVGRRRAPHCALRKPVCHLQSSFKLNSSGMKTTPLSLLTDEELCSLCKQLA